MSLPEFTDDGWSDLNSVHQPPRTVSAPGKGNNALLCSEKRKIQAGDLLPGSLQMVHSPKPKSALHLAIQTPPRVHGLVLVATVPTSVCCGDSSPRPPRCVCRPVALRPTMEPPCLWGHLVPEEMKQRETLVPSPLGGGLGTERGPSGGVSLVGEGPLETGRSAGPSHDL